MTTSVLSLTIQNTGNQTDSTVLNREIKRGWRKREHIASVDGAVSNSLRSSAEPLPKEIWQQRAQESSQPWKGAASGK